MSKLESKLLDLGYELEEEDEKIKIFVAYLDCFKLEIILFEDEFLASDVFSITRLYKTQQDIDDLQQAFNVLQNDLEVLKNV